MKHIVKNPSTGVIQSYKAEIKANSLDKNSLLNPAVYPGMSGGKLWRLVKDLKRIPHFWQMKHQMMAEQGGICCFCGLKISFGGNVNASVEHIIPKGVQRELVGEYENMLLSCSLTDNEEKDLKNGVKQRKDLAHCDDTKGYKYLNYTPLQTDCSTRFKYDINGHVYQTDELSKTDIETLNLDCTALVDRRISAMSILFDDNGNILPNEDLQMISNTIMKKQSDGTYREFCFVIKSAVDNYLSLAI